MEEQGEREREERAESGREREGANAGGGGGGSDRESSAAFPVPCGKQVFSAGSTRRGGRARTVGVSSPPVGRMRHLTRFRRRNRSASSCNLTDYSGNSSSVSRLFSSTRRRKISRDFVGDNASETSRVRLCANGPPHRIFHAIQFLFFFPSLFSLPRFSRGKNRRIPEARQAIELMVSDSRDFLPTTCAYYRETRRISFGRNK